MQIHDYIPFARRWLPIALVLAVIFGGASYALSKYVLKPVYTATATMEVVPPPSSTSQVVDSTYTASLAATEAAVAESGPVVTNGFHIAAKQQESTIAAENRLLRQQSPTASCQINGVTALFSCSVTANSPSFASRAANGLVTAFLAQEQAASSSRYTTVLGNLQTAAKNLRNHITYLEGRLNTATTLRRPTQGIVQLIANSQSQLAVNTNAQTTTETNQATQSTLITVVTPALTPIAPSSPHPTLNAIVAFFLVFLLVLGCGLAAFRLNDAVTSDEELKKLTGLPVLGSVPFVASLRGHGRTPESLITMRAPRSPIAESLRVIRTSISLSSFDDPARVLLVTSSVQDEGKSTIAANLAVAFAESGKSTILVDLDMRRPSVAKIFGTSGPGISNLLIDDEESQRDLSLPTQVPNLRVLPTGPLPPTPAEMIGSQRMKTVIASLRTQADMIVIDCPPLLAVADATIAATMCDAAIIVVRPDIIKRQMILRSLEVIQPTGIRIAGMVINSVTPKGQSGYLAYRYSQYDYGESPKSPTDTPNDKGKAQAGTDRVVAGSGQ